MKKELKQQIENHELYKKLITKQFVFCSTKKEAIEITLYFMGLNKNIPNALRIYKNTNIREMLMDIITH